MSAVVDSNFKDFHVADLSLADWGRKEIRIAETEMPGLMAVREEFARTQPLIRCVRRGAARIIPACPRSVAVPPA